MSVTLNAGGLPVNVALVLQDIGAVHLAVVLVVVGDNATESGVATMSVWDRAVKGVGGDALAVVTMIELRAMDRGMGGIGDFAVGAFTDDGGVRSGLGRG